MKKSRLMKCAKCSILMLVFLLCTVRVCISAQLFEDENGLLLDYREWKVVADSKWPGESTGYIQSIEGRKEGLSFMYDLHATKAWPWPEIDFFVEFSKAFDFTSYKGVHLKARGTKKTEEFYFYMLTEDKNTGEFKPSWRRFVLTDEFEDIYLPFEQFVVAKDWSVRNPKHDSNVEWNKVKACGVHKKGRDGEKGAIELSYMQFLKRVPERFKDESLETLRSQFPNRFLVDLNTEAIGLAEATINIYTSYEAEKISPYLYGVNWGVWLDFPELAKVKPLRVGLIRSGGPFIDRANWRNSKFTFPGNSSRPILMRSVDEFVKYCHQLGAEPLIQVNALGFAPDDTKRDAFTNCITADDAADLVRYLNQEKKYGVKFFEIGNEPFIWHKVHFDVRDKALSIEEYFEIYKNIAIAMKRKQHEIDPSFEIKIFAPGISTSYLNWETHSLGANDGRSSLEYFLQESRDFQSNYQENPEGFRILDVLSFHLFPSFDELPYGNLYQDYTPILQSTQNWWNPQYRNTLDRSLPREVSVQVLPKFRRVISENYPDVELALTEFAIESDSMVHYDPLLKVLYLSDLYGILAKSGVEYAAQFCLNSSDQFVALIDETDNATPLYYPFALFSRNFTSTIIDVRSSIPEKLTVYACADEETIVVMAINKVDRTYFTKLAIQPSEQSKEVFSFFHEFPKLSVTCLKIPKDNRDSFVECWEYGAAQIYGTLYNNPDM